jgi:alkanesulfonate monooxygenase SsuD/methylene tetrahydromethanopterin reductase-like flavin-dependent oxidoreductase (luciferase family)
MDTAVVDAYRERLGRVGVWLGSRAIVSVTAAEERAAVAEIEELGYGSLWIGAGGMGKDELTHAAVLLAAARRLVVATGISPIWGREAFNTAGGAGLLADAYPGRFVLGLGVSHAPQVTARGIDYHRPYRAMVTYLDRMDAAGYPGPPPAEPAPPGCWPRSARGCSSWPATGPRAPTRTSPPSSTPRWPARCSAPARCWCPRWR